MGKVLAKRRILPNPDNYFLFRFVDGKNHLVHRYGELVAGWATTVCGLTEQISLDGPPRSRRNCRQCVAIVPPKPDP